MSTLAPIDDVEIQVLDRHWDRSGAMLLALGAIRARDGGQEAPY